MRRVMLSLLLAGGLTTMATSAFAVNCDQVRRYLSTGRSVDDVAETMIISVDEVKKCQQAGGTQPQTGQKPEQKPAAQPPAGEKKSNNQ